jgi:DNA-binding NtrC family response regulator
MTDFDGSLMSDFNSPSRKDGASSATPVTVLVVEDEALVRSLVVEVLEEAGYLVREAAEAKAALTVLESGAALALLVTDVGLPGVNGKQLAQQARALRPDLKVLYMTGYTDGALVDPDTLPPGFDLITKPFDLDVLAAKAAELLG